MTQLSNKNFKEIKPKNEDWATINWQVTDWCNYKCSYCNEFNRGGKFKNNKKIDVMLLNLEKIINIYKKNNINYFKFAITGGEPSVWTGLIPLIKKFRELVGYEGHLVSLNTNLSRDIDWWEKNYQHFDKITASFHAEFTDKNDYINKYAFLQNKINILARIMMHKDYFFDCVDLANQIKKCSKNYHIEFSPILSTLSPNVSDYSYIDPAQMEFLKNNNIEWQISDELDKPNKISTMVVLENNQTVKAELQKIVNNKQNSFYDWECDIYKGLFIGSSGNITLATCGQGKFIGNIFLQNIEDNFLKSVICKKSWCLCDTDICISKRKRLK